MRASAAVARLRGATNEKVQLSEIGLRGSELEAQLELLGGDVHGALEEVGMPMYVVDRGGRIRWLNEAGKKLIPGGTGKKLREVVAPDQVHPTLRHFALRMLGREAFTDHETVLKTPDGLRHEAEISSVPLRRGHRIVGVFGVVRSDRVQRKPPESGRPLPVLTPRQSEVLHLLGEGLTTQQMADRMGLATETVRNHVRGVLAHLGARSRLEAVLLAHRYGLIAPPGPGAIDPSGSGDGRQA
jgi:DNA-binding CsgD family transcriptional regulator